MKKTWFIAILLIGLGIYVYSKNKTPTAIVEIVELERIQVAKTVSGSGTVTSRNVSNLTFPIAGQITEINVEKGDFVEKGEILARVFSSDAYLTSQSRKDARDVALRDLDLYKENYETNLSAAGGQDEYMIAIRRLQELASSAEATYQASLSALSKYYIQAPFSGTVLDVNGELGEISSVATYVVKLADLDNLVLEVDLDQEDFSLVRLGQKAEITLEAYPDVVLEGEVVETPLFVDSVDQESFVVKIKIAENKDYPVLLGMDGDVDININETEDEVNALSFDRIFFDDDNNAYVWINDNGSLVKKYVDVGLEGDIYTEITTDLSGLQIVVPSTTEVELEEGMNAKVLPN